MSQPNGYGSVISHCLRGIYSFYTNSRDIQAKICSHKWPPQHNNSLVSWNRDNGKVATTTTQWDIRVLFSLSSSTKILLFSLHFSSISNSSVLLLSPLSERLFPFRIFLKTITTQAELFITVYAVIVTAMACKRTLNRVHIFGDNNKKKRIYIKELLHIPQPASQYDSKYAAREKDRLWDRKPKPSRPKANANLFTKCMHLSYLLNKH